MGSLLHDIIKNVSLEEGTVALEDMLLSVYFNEGISTKELSRELLLPVPVIAAIKNEFKKAGLIKQDRGIRLTEKGKDYVEQTMGYAGLDRVLYNKAIYGNLNLDDDFDEEIKLLSRIFENRPEVDATIDQSKCTVETSIQRAVLCLRNKSLIGKRILCVGDDDLVSISLGLLAKRLFPGRNSEKCFITVLDINERFLDYIKDVAQKAGLNVECRKTDLREPLDSSLLSKYDSFFTDPPYTMPGLELFLSRGISALRKEPGLTIFLSFAHKSPDFGINMQRVFLDMGLIISEIIPRFNMYEGAEIIGNTGQMIVLKTTRMTKPMISNSFSDAFI